MNRSNLIAEILHVIECISMEDTMGILQAIRAPNERIRLETILHVLRNVKDVTSLGNGPSYFIFS